MKQTLLNMLYEFEIFKWKLMAQSELTNQSLNYLTKIIQYILRILEIQLESVLLQQDLILKTYDYEKLNYTRYIFILHLSPSL